MTELRRRFIEDMQLRNFSPRTIESYVHAVNRLANHYNKSPNLITDEELRAYFVHTKNIKKWSYSATSIALCGIKKFYVHTLGREWPAVKIRWPKKEKRLPPILSIAEVHRVFAAVKMDHHRVCLKTIYSLGLRLREAQGLQVAYIDAERMFVHIHKGKGNKDRMVPLPKRTLYLLRQHWKSHRNPVFLFPAPSRGKSRMSTSDKPIPPSSIQIAFKEAAAKALITKKVSLHHLRHAYAVHLLEAGVPFRFVQQYLGHADPKTTMIYAQMLNPAHVNPVTIINDVMDNI